MYFLIVVEFFRKEDKLHKILLSLKIPRIFYDLGFGRKQSLSNIEIPLKYFVDIKRTKSAAIKILLIIMISDDDIRNILEIVKHLLCIIKLNV
jgi:hypothetical protein